MKYFKHNSFKKSISKRISKNPPYLRDRPIFEISLIVKTQKYLCSIDFVDVALRNSISYGQFIFKSKGFEQLSEINKFPPRR